MEFRDMSVDLSGEELTRQEVDHTVRLRTSGGNIITIEGYLKVESTAGTYQASPGPDTANELVARLEPLLHRRISSADIETTGGLAVTFDDGTRLHVDADDRYEAWTIAGPDGQMVVSGPGGKLTEWPGDGTR
jgi:hypothetical protein